MCGLIEPGGMQCICMLEWTEENDIKAPEEVHAVGWISKDNNVVVLSIVKKLRAHMRPMAIMLNCNKSTDTKF